MIRADGRMPLSKATHAVTVAAVLLLSGCTGEAATPAPSPVPATARSASPAIPQPSVSPSAPPGAHTARDIAFVTQLLQHHQQMVMLVELASRRSGSAEIRQQAAAILSGRKEQSLAMAKWLRGWDQPVPGRAQWDEGDPHNRPGMIPAPQLANLAEVSATLFDRQWLSTVITHHRGVLALASDEQRTGRNPSVKALAATVSTTHARELTTLKLALAKLTGS
ncbi:DUF305 domain-containing protein [Kribbella catacumbae]|uniref:DUF305 domain-containing protein n=1 Tax=Kribbella catacumbae TaxID=460086 RepID=UPI0003A67C4F|nr:DUF305 domain-containing protein [Kribbella catacumbae]